MSGMSKGITIGMCICVFVGIVLSELGGFHIAGEMSIVFGSAVGIVLRAVLERRYALLTGLVIGMISCVTVGIIFLEPWGFRVAISIGIVTGMVIGYIMGTAFEARQKKTSYSYNNMI